ncbi:Aminomethyltransferase folate-binding domain-containing protein [Patellaria atrata CBS 101060]|uniref:Iron-sulfur cluster assembly factor IBA57 homolog, mitochondrial n=1 Tax=Patellaria atrata CBS 101060 TaxID=1346257 RepID=A0A9P4S380_9PEZI|nr:Aminomethyltransferase folate-binding domain-containing protein [Patellaria atrata CBS 101060]
MRVSRTIRRPDVFICARCKYRRTYSTAVNLPPAPPASGIAQLSDRRLISLSGIDAGKFLQGLTSNNVTAANPPRGWYSGFFTADGKVLYDTFVYRVGWSKKWKEWLGANNAGQEEYAYFIEVDAKEVAGLSKHLKRYKLRSKIDIRVIENDEWAIWAAWRKNVKEQAPIVDAAAAASTGTSPELEQQLAPSPQDDIILPDPRVPGFGDRLVLPADMSPKSLAPFEELDQTTIDSYTIRRYLTGIPEGQSEIPPATTLPLKLNMDYMSGIHFRKGCYVGQEKTHMTKFKGVSAERVLPVQLYPEPGSPEKQASPPNFQSYDPSWDNVINPPVNTVIKRTDADVKSRNSPGRWIAGIGNIGLAMCRLEMMTDVKLTVDSISTMWKPGTEFGMKWIENGGQEKTVRVKAFVPEWHKPHMGIREPPRRVQ